jgi:nucleoside-diphosphate-sugar epimerase
MLTTLQESNRSSSFLYTSGVWAYGDTGNTRVTEASPVNPAAISAWRPPIETLVLRASSDRLATLVLRPGIVYGAQGGIPAMWFESAIQEGAARIVGEGNNRWAMVHVEDLAAAYLAAGHSRARAEIFNVTDRSRFTVREMASAAARAAGKSAEVKLTALADAAKMLGQPYAQALALDQHVDSWKAVHLLGWNPSFGGFADEADLFYGAWKNAQR